MATINVRQLDEDVVERLERRAALDDRSLEGEARHTLLDKARCVESMSPIGKNAPAAGRALPARR